LRRGARRSGRKANPIDEALARLERDIPRLLRQLRSNMRELQTQVDRARADGEKRWKLAEGKLKKDAARLRQGLESAIGRVRGRGRRIGADRRRLLLASRLGALPGFFGDGFRLAPHDAAAVLHDFVTRHVGRHAAVRIVIAGVGPRRRARRRCGAGRRAGRSASAVARWS